MLSMDSSSLTPLSSSSAAVELPCWWREALGETGRLGWDGDKEPTVHVVDVHSLTLFWSWENPKWVDLGRFSSLGDPLWVNRPKSTHFGFLPSLGWTLAWLWMFLRASVLWLSQPTNGTFPYLSDSNSQHYSRALACSSKSKWGLHYLKLATLLA